MTVPFKMQVLFCLIVISLILWGWAASIAFPSVKTPALAVTIPALDMDASNHAQNKHGWLETGLIMDCLDKNGPYMGLKFKGLGNDKDKFFIPCALPDGRIALAIFDDKGNNITAYVPKDGTWAQVREYILSKATRFTGGLKWLGK